ncbi:MAG TPA: transglycosylase SLT domain-containing protein [Acidimicrobiales bacterium]
MRRQLRLIATLLGLGLLVAAGAAGFTAGGTYLVKPGDTLWAISRKHGVSVSTLASANNMRPSDLLLIGRKLNIPTKQDPPPPALQTATTPSQAAPSPQPAANPWTFCSTFQPNGGPWGVLPSQLRHSPKRLSLQPLFIKWANHYNLSLALLEAIAWQESGWQQGVISPVGAVGAGQIMPGTANFITSNLIGMPMNINSVSDNVRMSAAFLGYLSDLENNNLCATIAAYYEGPLNLGHYGVFPESQQYVASVEALIPRFE